MDALALRTSFYKRVMLGKIVMLGYVMILVCLGYFQFVAKETVEAAAPVIPVMSLSPVVGAQAYQTPRPIREWLVIGSFPMEHRLYTAEDNAKPVGLNQDYLSAFAVSERQLDEQSILSLVNVLRSGRQPFQRKIEVGISKGDTTSLATVLGKDRYSVAYAATIIDSPRDAVLALVACGTEALKIWVDNALVSTTPNDVHRTFLPDYIVPLRLHRGRNLVVLKVSHMEQLDWGFAVSVASLEYGRHLSANLSHDVLGSVLLMPGDQISPSLELSEQPLQMHVSLLDSDKNIVFSSVVDKTSLTSGPLPALPSGIYECVVSNTVETREQSVYLGTIDEIPLLYRRLSSEKQPPDAARAEIDTLLFRLDELFLPIHKKPHELDWQDKVVFVLREMETVLHDVDQNRTAFLSGPGFHLRAFRSAIDGQVQAYAAYRPKGESPSGGWPVMLLLPYPGSGIRPFAVGANVADRFLSLYFEHWADKYGVVMLVLFGRGDAAGSLVQEADYREAFQDAQKYYRMDLNRLSLVSTCEGARRAFMVAAHYPALFAAVAVYGPEMSANFPSLDAPNDPVSDKNSASWMPNLINVPIFIQQGLQDYTSSSETYQLVKECNGIGARCTLEEVPEDGHSVWKEFPFEAMARFCNGKRRATFPKRVRLRFNHLKYGEAYWVKVTGLADDQATAQIEAEAKSPELIDIRSENIISFDILPWQLSAQPPHNLVVRVNGDVQYSGPVDRDKPLRVNADATRSAALRKTPSVEGPIADAFASPFILVVSTQGTSAETNRNWNDAVAVQQAWQKDFFVACRMKRDVEITSTERKNLNLIVFGAPQSNSLLKDRRFESPIQVNGDRACVGEKCYSGSDYSLEYIYPSPFATNRYVVIVSSAPMATPPIEMAEPWRERKDDYVLYTGAEGSRKQESGVFGSEWTATR
jgi:pimeloyl-ACP methyl ester carboxylesterase